MSRFKIRERLAKRFVGDIDPQNTITILEESRGAPKELAEWQPLDSQVKDWDFWAMKPEVLLAIDTNDWSKCVTEIAPDIYRVQLFEPTICTAMYSELLALERWAKRHRVEVSPPNSMHNYGIEARRLGFQSVFDQFVREVANPMARSLFPEVVDSGLTSQHAFFVTYGGDHNRSLGFHADDSEVTFNFCLGGDFVGSDLYFQGRRCFGHMQTEHRPEEHVEIEQIPGTCVVHAGLHRHGVTPLLQGERRSLIVWTHSESFRARDGSSECTDWCAATK